MVVKYVLLAATRTSELPVTEETFCVCHVRIRDKCIFNPYKVILLQNVDKIRYTILYLFGHHLLDSTVLNHNYYSQQRSISDSCC